MNPPKQPGEGCGTPGTPKQIPVVRPSVPGESSSTLSRPKVTPQGGAQKTAQRTAPETRQNAVAPFSAAQATSQPRPAPPLRPPAKRPRPPALISQGERILFWLLLGAVLLMSVFLIHLRNRTAAHFLARAQAVPLASAEGATAPGVLALANDATGALTERPLAFPLPPDPNTRARVVLEKLLAEYTVPGSAHPLQPGPPGTESVHEVFLAPAPGTRGLLAVVDLTQHFVHAHPSGIEPESLTILSMIATLHANLPQVAEVRFLVDGETRPTLAGHAALDQTFLAGATEMAPSEAFTSGARP